VGWRCETLLKENSMKKLLFTLSLLISGLAYSAPCTELVDKFNQDMTQSDKFVGPMVSPIPDANGIVAGVQFEYLSEDGGTGLALVVIDPESGVRPVADVTILDKGTCQNGKGDNLDWYKLTVEFDIGDRKAAN
jgi:hypothetical protein